MEEFQTSNLTYRRGRFPADVPVCPDITGQLGVVRGQNSALQLGRGGGGKIAKWVWAKGDIYPFNEGGGGRGKRFRTNNRQPELTISQQHFPSKDTFCFFANLPASKNSKNKYFEEQIH